MLVNTNESQLADPCIGLAQAHSELLRTRTSRSRARLSSLASVGNITAFGHRGVNHNTGEIGRHHRVRPGRHRQAFLQRALSLSSPIRWRQRVSDDRSNANAFRERNRSCSLVSRRSRGRIAKFPAASARARRIAARDSRESSKLNFQANTSPRPKIRQIRLLVRAQSFSPFNGF